MRKTIAIVLPNLRGGGAERLHLLLAEEFETRGYDVEFLLLQAKGELLDAVPAGVRVIDLKAPRLRSAFAPLVKRLREKPPHAMIAAMWPLTAVVALAKARAKAPTRLVLSEHNDLTRNKALAGPSGYVHRLFGRAIYGKGDAVVAVSKGLARDLEQRARLPAGSAHAIYNPVAPSKGGGAADPELLAWWRGGEAALIGVGALKVQKDYRTMLRALAELRRTRDVRLLILGEGPDRPVLEALVAELGLQDGVRMPGFVEDPFAYLRQADLFVMASIFEGLGNVLIEALLAGIPVVSTDCPWGPGEILEGGRLGRLVPIEDPAAMAAAISEALASQVDHEALRARGRYFSPQRAADEYLALLDPPRGAGRKAVLFANTDWYLYNFRLSLISRLRELGWDLLLLSPPGEYGERLATMGFRWQPLPMNRRSLNPASEAALLAKIVAILRREKPDLIHNFTIKPTVYGSLAALAAGVKGRINAVAGLGYVFISNEPRARVLRPIVRRLLKLALGGKGARLILQNPDDLALFKAAGLARGDEVRLIPGSGVDCTRFTPGKPPKAAGPLTVLVATRLLWDKGLAEFIEAARLLKKEGRTIRFQLAGEPDPGNPASVPEATVRSWADEGVVEWLGHVDDMPALLAAADVVVLPSYREGLPKTLIEAAACARALVTTDVPGCREVVSDGVDGLLVPVRTVEPLAAAIARLDDGRALAARLGAAAREKALALFDERIVIDRTMAVYEELAPAVG